MFLREKQLEFLENKEDWLKVVYSSEVKRKRFIELFNLVKLKTMTIDEYIVGKGDKETFCYWLETELIELGSIKGGSPADKKFGVYYGITKTDKNKKYRSLPKWGEDPNIAFEKIRAEIISLVENGNDPDSDVLIQNKISPMFKGKILSTYYPEKFLSVFSESHLDYFLNLFNVRFNSKSNPFHKRKLLEKIKISDIVFEKMTLLEFSFFLYKSFPPPRNEYDKKGKNSELRKEVELLSEFKIDHFPLYENIKFNFIELNENYINIPHDDSLKSEESKKVDFELRSSKFKLRGEKGEFYILELEKDFLIKNKREDLALKVSQVSKISDSFGYDILSFEIDGREKYIEVKSTVGNSSEFSFYITANELAKSKILVNYYIYLVFEIDSEHPQIAKLKNPFKNNSFKLNPVLFKINLKTKK